MNSSKIVPNSSREVGNTKQLPPRKHWVFTLNNWTDSEYSSIVPQFQTHKYVIGKEVGEGGTPHLQGYVEFDKKVRLTAVKKIIPRAHWEPARSPEDAREYCKKDGDYITNIVTPLTQNERYALILRDEYANVVWKGWQQDVLDLLHQEPDKRSVHWLYEESGNVGKSYLMKYVALTMPGVILGSGKKNDVFNQVLTYMNTNKGCEPKIVILDIPRTAVDYINYDTIEQLKNGIIYSGKYEGGMCIFKSPHVVVFANSAPDEEKLSRDRWVIRQLGDDWI